VKVKNLNQNKKTHQTP